LTDSAANDWDPHAQTTIYTGKPIVDSTNDNDYNVELSSVGSLDNSGVLELADDGETKEFEFSLVQVEGQRRIDEITDGINVVVCVVGVPDTVGVLELAYVVATNESASSLVQVDGQWPIDQVPDGISLASSQLRALFNTQPLYLYDPSYSYAVPDVRWLLNT